MGESQSINDEFAWLFAEWLFAESCEATEDDERQVSIDKEAARIYARYDDRDINRVWARSSPFLGVRRPEVPMRECQICDDIWQMLADPESAKKEVVLGSFEQALASPCLRHTPIIQAFKDYVGSSCSSTDVGFRNDGNRRQPIELWESLNELCDVFCVLLAKKDYVADHTCNSLVLYPEWVDMDLLRYCVAQCL